MNLGGISQGIINGMQANQQNQSVDQEQQLKQLQIKKYQQDMAAADAAAKQSQADAQQLSQNANIAVPNGPQPPMPGQSSMPMHPPAMQQQGQGQPPGQPQQMMPRPPQQMMGQQQNQGMAPPMQGMQQQQGIPPYQSAKNMQAPQQTPQQQPMAPPTVEQVGRQVFQGASALDTALANLKKANVPFDQQLKLLNSPDFKNYISENDKQKLAQLNVEKEARQAAKDAYEQTMGNKNYDLSVKKEAATEKYQQAELGIQSSREKRESGQQKTSTLEYKLAETKKMLDQGAITQKEYNSRKAFLVEGRNTPHLGEEKAYAQGIQLSLANKELEKLSQNKTTMPFLGDIHIDSNGIAGATGRLGIKKALSDEEQQFVAAAQLYAEAAGHIQSGARLTQSAFNRAVGEFIDQPGDKPGTLKVKKDHRDALVEGSVALAGPLGDKLKAQQNKTESSNPTAIPGGWSVREH